VQIYNKIHMIEIVGIESVGWDHLVFQSVRRTGEGEGEVAVEEFVVVPDYWVDLSV
jgi:hypothetical protein